MPQTVVDTAQAWRQLKTGGGGWVTKMDVHSDGSIIIGPDTAGAYIRRPGDAQWNPILTTSSIPSEYHRYDFGFGFFELRFAPSDSDIIWVAYQNKPMRSTDGGATFIEKSTDFGIFLSGTGNASSSGTTVTLGGSPDLSSIPINLYTEIYLADATETNKWFRLSAVDNTAKTVTLHNGPLATPVTTSNWKIRTAIMGSNEATNGSRVCGPYMAVDPVNPDVVYLSSGFLLFRTLDGGTTWSVCSGIGRPSSYYPGVAGLAIDHSSSNSSTPTRKSIIMVNVSGQGWYRSTNGGDSFSAVAGGPVTSGGTTINDGVFNDNGVFLATDRANVWRYASGTWLNTGAGGGEGAAYACVDPFATNRVVCLTQGGQMYECLDISVATPTWNTEPTPATRDGMNIPWVAIPGEEVFMSAGPGRFSKVTQNRFIFPQGVGMWYADIAPGFTTIPYKFWTEGIENLVGYNVRKFSGNKHIYLPCGDRSLFISGNPEAYADTTRSPIYNAGFPSGLRGAFSVDAADTNHNMVIVLNSGGKYVSNACGVTTDAGKTWTPINLPPIYAEMVVSFNSISTVSGSPTVTITNGRYAHGLTTGNWTGFERAETVGGVSLAGKKYQVTVVDTNTFTITYATNASGTATGGGNVRHTTYKHVKSNAFSTTYGSPVVRFAKGGGYDFGSTEGEHGAGDRFYFYGTSTIGGLTIEGEQVITNVGGWTDPGGVWVEFEPGGTANADVPAGGGTNVCFWNTWQRGQVPLTTQIVMSTETNWMLFAGAGRVQPFYTTDAGVTWAESSFPSAVEDIGWGFSYNNFHSVADSEPGSPGTFYAYSRLAGTFRSTDGGATFTLRSSNTFTPLSVDQFHMQMYCVPGKPGHLFWIQGSSGGFPYQDQSGRGYFSTDGGSTWNIIGVATLGGADVVGEIEEPGLLGFSATKPGSSYPTIWLQGWINGEYGIYYCTNADPLTTGKWTWNRVQAFPNGCFDFHPAMCGDPDSWHTCYLSGQGSGWWYTTQDDVTKRTFEITT
jgi:hypothetical protein